MIELIEVGIGLVMISVASFALGFLCGEWYKDSRDKARRIEMGSVRRRKGGGKV